MNMGTKTSKTLKHCRPNAWGALRNAGSGGALYEHIRAEAHGKQTGVVAVNTV
jgi:hypothetical protein